MRYVLIILGLICLGLGVALARERLWFLAIPDGLFGLGVAALAALSLRHEGQPVRAPAGPVLMPSEPAPPVTPPASTGPAPPRHRPRRSA